jgi:hypothetical protein
LSDERASTPRIWALIGARAGDNDQVIALAEALGLPFEIKQLQYNAFRLLGPRLLRRSLISLITPSRRMILSEPPPDLTISAGHRSVAVVQALRHRSGGWTRSIHVGFPRVSPGEFDLVVATPQYPIADHPNLLRVPYALTRAANAEIDSPEQLANLPKPHQLLIVGGPTLFWTIDERMLLTTLGDMLQEASAGGGSVLVTTSPRTPHALRHAIARKLADSDVPSLLARPRQAPRYGSLLETADSIQITADSVAMTSDAIWTGKPVALVPVVKSPLGRAVIAINEALRPGRRLYPQDLRFFWRALADIGVGDRLARPRTSTDEEMRNLLDRVRPILESVGKDRTKKKPPVAQAPPVSAR